MSTPSHYLVLAFYRFCPVEDPHGEVQRHHAFFEGRDCTCRVYISEEGINAQMCMAPDDAAAYMEWLQSHPSFKDTHIKIQYHHEHCFPKFTIKYRQQLAALDAQVDMAKTGTHVSPEQWAEMLEDDQDRILIDVRNDYEWKVGHFEGAELPACETFREFNDYADELKERMGSTKKPVMMYCTGGIRCELYSALLKEKGIDEVYQLQGGVIHYGEKQGSKHWQGKLFVFDDRLTVPVSTTETAPVIGQCHHCGEAIENYYNCANVECNELFLCCDACLPEFKGCCSTECTEAERVRPYQEASPHKPFRKWSQCA